MMFLSLIFCIICSGSCGESLVHSELRAEDLTEEERGCCGCFYKCFYKCFRCCEHVVIVLLYVSIAISLMSLILLGAIAAVGAFGLATCSVSEDNLTTLCPGLHLLEQGSSWEGVTKSIDYFCSCNGTVYTETGACNTYSGWSTSNTYTAVCASEDTLRSGFMFTLGGEAVSTLLCIIMFGNLIKHTEHVGTMMETSRKQATERMSMSYGSLSGSVHDRL